MQSQESKRDRAFRAQAEQRRRERDDSAVILVDDAVITFSEARRRGMIREIENPYTRTTPAFKPMDESWREGERSCPVWQERRIQMRVSVTKTLRKCVCAMRRVLSLGRNSASDTGSAPATFIESSRGKRGQCRAHHE